MLLRAEAVHSSWKGVIGTPESGRERKVPLTVRLKVALSYSYETQEIAAALGGMVTEHVPLLPETQPFALYGRLFSGMAPGMDAAAARNALLLRKSVLDYSLGELKRLHGLAPASEREKLDVHADAIRKVELALQGELDSFPGGCVVPSAPDALLAAKTGSKPISLEPVYDGDASLVGTIGKLHAAVIRAAFQCDLARVATLQWCPGTNHVAFAEMNPFDDTAIYEMGSFHYRESLPQFFFGAPPADSASNAYVYETLFGMTAGSISRRRT